MPVTIKLHRGADQIGGTITEIYTENTHIFVDFGLELSVPEEKSTDADMIRMMQQAKCDGVLFTHYHGDHIGLMEKIPEQDVQGNPILLCIGETARSILQNIHRTLLNNPDISDNKRTEHEHLLHILQDEDRWENLSDGASFDLGDFKITPVSVDHSAFDAYLFIIEAEGKCIVHTGDFRTHGRLGKDLFERLSEHLQGKNVDVLLTEGTMMSRLNERVLTEEDLENKVYKVLGEPGNEYVFLLCSSTNVESLASFHNAARHLGRPLIVNPYVRAQMDLYSESIGQKDKRFLFNKAYPIEPVEWFNYRMKTTQMKYMEEHGFVMLVGTSDFYTKRMEHFRKLDPKKEPLLIYSMWNGYLDEKGIAFNPKLKALYDKWPRHRDDLHTSGHACKEDIEEMIRLVKPGEAIIPIHTEKKEMFSRLDIGELRSIVHPMSDGDRYVIGDRS